MEFLFHKKQQSAAAIDVISEYVKRQHGSNNVRVLILVLALFYDQMKIGKNFNSHFSIIEQQVPSNRFVIEAKYENNEINIGCDERERETTQTERRHRNKQCFFSFFWILFFFWLSRVSSVNLHFSIYSKRHSISRKFFFLFGSVATFGFSLENRSKKKRVWFV